MSVRLGLNAVLNIDSQIDETKLEKIIEETSKLARIVNFPITYTNKGTLGKYFQEPEITKQFKEEVQNRYILKKDPNNQKGQYSLKI
ncbi:MAG: hypothetical protein PF569_02860 [Candidatus Woesearchaeota archaeon]|jgi:hypothetical protein|nr:hypothetical protein [Candidatus Woesearchaeota archaeon]